MLSSQSNTFFNPKHNNFKLKLALGVEERSQAEDFFIVPRESHLKEILSKFNQGHPLLKEKNLMIVGLNSQNPGLIDSNNDLTTDDQFRINNYQKVSNLAYFNNLTPSVLDMTNGHAKKSSNKNFKHRRILTICNRSNREILGAIYFSLYLGAGHLFLDHSIKERSAFINILSVKKDQRNKGLGSVLLSAAILYTLIYGVDRIILESKQKALSLYLRHGFTYSYLTDNDEEAFSADINEILELESMIHDEGFDMDDEIKLQLHLAKSFNQIEKLINIPEFSIGSYPRYKEWFLQPVTLNKQDFKEDRNLLDNKPLSPIALKISGKRTDCSSAFRGCVKRIKTAHHLEFFSGSPLPETGFVTKNELSEEIEVIKP